MSVILNLRIKSQVVERTLEEIGSDDKPTLLLFNKTDLLEDEDARILRFLVLRSFRD